MARSTVYRYFPGRDDLLVAIIKDEMEQARTIEFASSLASYHDPADQMVEGLILALQEIPRRPLLRAVFASPEDSRAREVVWSSDVIVNVSVRS